MPTCNVTSGMDVRLGVFVCPCVVCVCGCVRAFVHCVRSHACVCSIIGYLSLALLLSISSFQIVPQVVPPVVFQMVGHMILRLLLGSFLRFSLRFFTTDTSHAPAAVGLLSSNRLEGSPARSTPPPREALTPRTVWPTEGPEFCLTSVAWGGECPPNARKG